VDDHVYTEIILNYYRFLMAVTSTGIKAQTLLHISTRCSFPYCPFLAHKCCKILGFHKSV